jgi:hypothetical protein
MADVAIRGKVFISKNDAHVFSLGLANVFRMWQDALASRLKNALEHVRPEISIGRKLLIWREKVFFLRP